jgi:hypothetical protein
VDVGEVDAAFFEDGTICHDAGAAASAFFALPRVFLECGFAVRRFELLADGVLEF